MKHNIDELIAVFKLKVLHVQDHLKMGISRVGVSKTPIRLSFIPVQFKDREPRVIHPLRNAPQ